MRLDLYITTPARPDIPQGKAGREAVEDIRAAMRRENIDASGGTSKGLAYIETDDRLIVKLTGDHAPAYSLQHGGGPHVNADPKGFAAEIKKWVRVKPGFKPRPHPSGDLNRAYDAAAWAIITKIRRDGTDRYRHPRRDIITPALTKAVETYRQRIGAIAIQLLQG